MPKKIIFIVLGIVLALLVILGLIFTYSMSPERVVNNYFKAIIEHKVAGAKLFLQPGEAKIEELTNKWSAADKVTYKIKKGEAWREKSGAFKPYPKALAGKYKAEIEVTVDGSKKTYEFTLQRINTTDFWNIFGYLFKGWNITSSKKLS